MIKMLVEEYNACSDADHLTLVESFDPTYIGSRLQECGIFSVTLASGEQRDILIPSYQCLAARRR